MCATMSDVVEQVAILVGGVVQICLEETMHVAKLKLPEAIECALAQTCSVALFLTAGHVAHAGKKMMKLLEKEEVFQLWLLLRLLRRESPCPLIPSR